MRQTSIFLEKGIAVRLPRTTESIICTEGTLWVTAQDARGQDIIISEGESLSVKDLVHAVVSPLNNASARLSIVPSPAREKTAGRVLSEVHI